MSETNYPKQLCTHRNKTREPESEWLNLPMDVAFLIQDKLFELGDHLCFAMVCKDWESLSEDYNKATGRFCEGKVLPSFWRFQSKFEGHQGLHSVFTGIRRNFRLPVNYSKRRCGSSHGWLATVDLVDLSLHTTLVYPCRESVAPICLPPLNFIANAKPLFLEDYKSNYKKYLPNVILSSNPNLNPDNYLVIAFYDTPVTKVAFIKGGQEHWEDWVYLDNDATHKMLHSIKTKSTLLGVWDRMCHLMLVTLMCLESSQKQSHCLSLCCSPRLHIPIL